MNQDSSVMEVITDAEEITPGTPDSVIVLVDAAAKFVGHTPHTMRQMRHLEQGPTSFLRSRRIAYRLGGLRSYNQARFNSSRRGGDY